jgi:hypothetical protein
MNIVTWRGSIDAISDGTTTRVYVSNHWRGTIQSHEPVVVYRERSWFTRLLARMKVRIRRG